MSRRTCPKCGKPMFVVWLPDDQGWLHRGIVCLNTCDREVEIRMLKNRIAELEARLNEDRT